VRRPKILETTAMGAGLTLSVWRSPAELKAMLKHVDILKPKTPAAKSCPPLARRRRARPSNSA